MRGMPQPVGLGTRRWAPQIHYHLASVVVVAAVALVAFKPFLSIGFFAEDNTIIGNAARLPFAVFVARYFQWGASATFYRPAEGILEWIQFRAFSDNPEPYRVIILLMHLANCLLVYTLVNHVGKRWRVAFLSALIFAVLPATNSVFLWITVPERFVTFFYLLAILFWIEFLVKKRMHYYVLALLAFVLALLTKEVGATLPLALFLEDRWLVSETVGPVRLLRRYVPFLLFLGLYALHYAPLLLSFTAGRYGGPYAGMALGSNLLSNLLFYVAALAYPWKENWPASLVWLVVEGLLILYFIAVRRRRAVAFCAATSLLPILPVLPFNFVGERYLYLPAIASAVLFALAVHATERRWATRRAVLVLGATCLTLVGLACVVTDAEAFDSMAAFVREWRSPVRPVFQQHPTFQSGTLLYFVNSPIGWQVLEGIATMRYGPLVKVGGTDDTRPAALRAQADAYIYVFDDKTLTTEQRVTSAADLQTRPAPPITFRVPIRLEGLDVSGEIIPSSESLIILSYWRATAKVARDYTVFTHLVDVNGDIVAGSDGQPRSGEAPTSTWAPGDLIVDWSVLPLADVRPGSNYHVEIGLYYLPTMERVGIVDAAGQIIADHLVLGPFSIGASQ